jgi:hypothetical protein
MMGDREAARVTIAPELAEQERRFAIADAVPAELHPKIARLVAYYRTLAPGPGLLPGRRQFDPMAVPALLPNIWLVDVVVDDPRRYRLRLVGTAVISSGAVTRPGQFFSDVIAPADARAAAALFDRVRQSRLIDWRRGRALFEHYKDIHALERVVLPLAADGDEVDMLMCMTLFYWTSGVVR